MGYEDEPDIVVDIAAEIVPLTEEMQDRLDPMRTGFKWYVPPLASTKEHEVGGHEWTISGNDMQILTTTVQASEMVVTEIGSFMYMSPFMETEVELTLCAKGGCGEGWSRICGGESCVKVYLKNDTSEEGYAGLTPNFPAKIIPIKFGTHTRSATPLIAQGGAIMTQLGDVEVGCDMDLSCKTCCCAGMGLCRQKLSASDGSVAFLAAGGTLVYKNLDEGETVTVDSGSIVAIEESVQLGIVSNGRFLTCCFGGEGCFSSTLTGPGRVYLQSYSFAKFAAAVEQTVMEERQDNGQNLQGVA